MSSVVVLWAFAAGQRILPPAVARGEHCKRHGSLVVHSFWKAPEIAVAYVNVPGAMWYCLGGVVEGVRAWFVTYAHMAMVALVMAICSFVCLHVAVLLLTTTLDSVRVVCVICRCALGICRRTTCFATCSCTGRALQEAWITCCALFLESPGDCSGGGICERSGCHVVLFRWCC